MSSITFQEYVTQRNGNPEASDFDQKFWVEIYDSFLSKQAPAGKSPSNLISLLSAIKFEYIYNI